MLAEGVVPCFGSSQKGSELAMGYLKKVTKTSKKSEAKQILYGPWNLPLLLYSCGEMSVSL